MEISNNLTVKDIARCALVVRSLCALCRAHLGYSPPARASLLAPRMLQQNCRTYSNPSTRGTEALRLTLHLL